MADSVGKWAAGSSYGPVLGQTDLYLLNQELELHPILTASLDSFQLMFNISTGQTGGYNHETRERELPFTAKDEPATLPRVNELIIITELSPWCTIVQNPAGVTLQDVCQAMWKDYTENIVTDKEFESLPPRLQEHVRRFAASGTNWGGNFYSPMPPASNRYRRVEWLRDKVWFDKVWRKESYIKNRLGFVGPNIFVMGFASF